MFSISNSTSWNTLQGVSPGMMTASAVSNTSKNPSGIKGTNELSDEEQEQLKYLQNEDRRVRAHEQAHVNAGGNLILQGAQYTYESGPDGKRYAVAGDVVIDTSPAETPAETIDKAYRIKAAALAPADPSAQDRQVAAMATQMAMQAQVELARETQLQASDATRDSKQSLQALIVSTYYGQQPATTPKLSIHA
jgi:hypothetical protein